MSYFFHPLTPSEPLGSDEQRWVVWGVLLSSAAALIAALCIVWAGPAVSLFRVVLPTAVFMMATGAAIATVASLLQLRLIEMVLAYGTTLLALAAGTVLLLFRAVSVETFLLIYGALTLVGVSVDMAFVSEYSLPLRRWVQARSVFSAAILFGLLLWRPDQLTHIAVIVALHLAMSGVLGVAPSVRYLRQSSDR